MEGNGNNRCWMRAWPATRDRVFGGNVKATRAVKKRRPGRAAAANMECQVQLVAGKLGVRYEYPYLSRSGTRALSWRVLREDAT